VVARSILVLMAAIAVGALVAHFNPGVRKPLLTPLVLCAAACAGTRVARDRGAFRTMGARAERAIPLLGALAAATCLVAYLGEGWREYRRLVLAVAAPVDPLTEAARAAAEAPSQQDPAIAKLIDQMNAGLALRAHQHEERGSLVDYTRSRWRNVGPVALLPRTRPVTLSLLAAECLIAWGLGMWIGGLVTPGETRLRESRRSSSGTDSAESPAPTVDAGTK
jgi:hypothetical protein